MGGIGEGTEFPHLLEQDAVHAPSEIFTEQLQGSHVRRILQAFHGLERHDDVLAGGRHVIDEYLRRGILIQADWLECDTFSTAGWQIFLEKGRHFPGSPVAAVNEVASGGSRILEGPDHPGGAHRLDIALVELLEEPRFGTTGDICQYG